VYTETVFCVQGLLQRDVALTGFAEQAKNGGSASL
jgi:hypothetical protein